MTRDELRGSVEDVLAVASLSDGQTIQMLLSRVNGAGLKDVLIAALSVAREQTRQIAELEYALRDSGQLCNSLEDEIQDLRDYLESLLNQTQTEGEKP